MQLLKLLASLIFYMKYKKLVIFYIRIDNKTLSLYILIMKIFFLGNHFA